MEQASHWPSPAPGAESPALAQSPDNRFQQIKLSGGYRFPSARTSVSASVAAGEIEQTATLLPYTGADSGHEETG